LLFLDFSAFIGVICGSNDFCCSRSISKGSILIGVIRRSKNLFYRSRNLFVKNECSGRSLLVNCCFFFTFFVLDTKKDNKKKSSPPGQAIRTGPPGRSHSDGAATNTASRKDQDWLLLPYSFVELLCMVVSALVILLLGLLYPNHK
jgi:hypothetical protein